MNSLDSQPTKCYECGKLVTGKNVVIDKDWNRIFHRKCRDTYILKMLTKQEVKTQ